MPTISMFYGILASIFFEGVLMAANITQKDTEKGIYA